MSTQSSRIHNTLDPRLRRLVDSIGDPTRLRDDLRNAVVNATRQLATDEEVHAADLTTTLLVEMRPHASPPDLAGVRWVEIVDDIYAADVPVTLLTTLALSPDVSYVEASRPLHPELQTSVPETRAHLVHHRRPAEAGLTGAGVVLGIIDHGLDFTLDDFRNADGTTRVAFLWDQSLTAGQGEHTPTKYGFGVEYNAQDINKALQSEDPFSVVQHKPSPASHGTHVAGIAAGNGRAADDTFPAGLFVGTAPEATIIFVHTQQRGTTFTNSPAVAQAVAYVFEKADELGRPCVINMSLGQNGGSHDGDSVVEQAIDRLLVAPGRALVSAAGNEHTWRGHASGRLATGQRRTLHWKVLGQLPPPEAGAAAPDAADRTTNEMEIWYSSRDRVQITLISPGGEVTATVNPGDDQRHTFATGNVADIRSERFTTLNGDARVIVEVAPGTADRVAPGTWQVVIDAHESIDGRFDAWIERDQIRSHPRATTQSFFVGADFDESKTLATPATSRRGIVVANYDHVTVALASSSSRGGTRDGRNKPEVAAPGTNILSAHALGGRPDPDGTAYPVRIAKSGTSMSSPHVAGIVALLLQLRPALTAAQLRKILIAGAAIPAGPAQFDIGWGYGAVNAAKAVDLLPNNGKNHPATPGAGMPAPRVR